MPPAELVETATNGIEYRPEPQPETVVLIPQYHFRPWNLFAKCGSLRFIHYPVEAVPIAPDEPPRGLVRLARALSDENRLRILRLLAGSPLTFTDIVRATGLSKSTVHHHMVILRAASLVRVETGGERGGLCRLRSDAVDMLHDSLGSYLQRPTGRV